VIEFVAPKRNSNAKNLVGEAVSTGFRFLRSAGTYSTGDTEHLRTIDISSRRFADGYQIDNQIEQ
jgi:hypothetical protein